MKMLFNNAPRILAPIRELKQLNSSNWNVRAVLALDVKEYPFWDTLYVAHCIPKVKDSCECFASE